MNAKTHCIAAMAGYVALYEALRPDGTAVGRRVNLSFGDPVWREVIGVVEDVRGRGLSEACT